MEQDNDVAHSSFPTSLPPFDVRIPRVVIIHERSRSRYDREMLRPGKSKNGKKLSPPHGRKFRRDDRSRICKINGKHHFTVERVINERMAVRGKKEYLRKLKLFVHEFKIAVDEIVSKPLF